VRTHTEHLAHTLNHVLLFERVGHCVPVGTDDKIYKTAYTRGLDVKKKYMNAYSIILDIKREFLTLRMGHNESGCGGAEGLI